jgi:hypothetical protein
MWMVATCHWARHEAPPARRQRSRSGNGQVLVPEYAELGTVAALQTALGSAGLSAKSGRRAVAGRGRGWAIAGVPCIICCAIPSHRTHRPSRRVTMANIRASCPDLWDRCSHADGEPAGPLTGSYVLDVNLLADRLFDDRGILMSPTHSRRRTTDGTGTRQPGRSSGPIGEPGLSGGCRWGDRSGRAQSCRGCPRQCRWSGRASLVSRSVSTWDA